MTSRSYVTHTLTHSQTDNCKISIMIAFITVPSGAPQMLTITETEVTNISLTWQFPPPDERNGVVLGFIVRLSSVSLRTETREITTVYTNITVTSLTPYTVYECVVSAYTSVGTGPPSSIILARTEPTSKSLYLYIDTLTINFITRSKWYPFKHYWSCSQFYTHPY